MPRPLLNPRTSFRAAVLSRQAEALTYAARLILLLLDDMQSAYQPVPFPKQAEIAAMTGIAERTVQDALRESAAQGWLARTAENACELLIPSTAVPAISADVQLEVLPSMAVSRVGDPAIKATLGAIREAAMSEAAEVVAAYYRDRMGKQATFVFDDKRRKRILARLREQPELNPSELLFAVDGARRDDFLMGRANGANRKYDGIETIFRDREQVERLAELGGMNGAPHKYLSQP